jgi:hypothetical protein
LDRRSRRAQPEEAEPCARVGGEVLQVVRVGREQHQRAETGRTDGVALGDGLGGVADRVERVGVVRTSFGRPAISAMPPALSVTGPKASSATIMPASASMVVTAMAMPNRPAS